MNIFLKIRPPKKVTIRSPITASGESQGSFENVESTSTNITRSGNDNDDTEYSNSESSYSKGENVVCTQKEKNKKKKRKIEDLLAVDEHQKKRKVDVEQEMKKACTMTDGMSHISRLSILLSRFNGNFEWFLD